MPVDYLLGADAEEHARLDAQHALWGPTLAADLDMLGIGAGHHVLEVGCGTGALLEDLAVRVGPSGRAVGLERDPTSAAAARRRLGSRAEVREGDLTTDDLGGPFDAIVVRWVLSFLPDAAAIVTRLAGALRPGGWLVVQDYVHDGLAIVPPDPLIDATIAGVRRAYADTGGDLWVGWRLPPAFAGAGLSDLRVIPRATAGPPDSPVARWIQTFLRDHGARLGGVDGLALAAALDAHAERPGATWFAPIQLTVAGRR